MTRVSTIAVLVSLFAVPTYGDPQDIQKELFFVEVDKAAVDADVAERLSDGDRLFALIRANSDRGGQNDLEPEYSPLYYGSEIEVSGLVAKSDIRTEQFSGYGVDLSLDRLDRIDRDLPDVQALVILPRRDTGPIEWPGGGGGSWPPVSAFPPIVPPSDPEASGATIVLSSGPPKPWPGGGGGGWPPMTALSLGEIGGAFSSLESLMQEESLVTVNPDNVRVLRIVQ
ncbi:hypothetical protein [Paracoccus sp. MKU1]|uniref:hypothetical protein n=1 Tax=Paracoccus sp. MKU1 TaxID=1745182 RepID=UPI000B114F2B|nr:hypothetical protein [Paracoccus sp. MKU1]